MVCFFNEQVDLQLDDEVGERPGVPVVGARLVARKRRWTFENRL